MSSNLNKVILVDSQLEDYFLKVQAKELQNISLFKVVIAENSLKLDYYNEGPIPGDFEQVNNSLQPEEPCYFLLKQSDISWSLISWLPEGHVKIRDRMKYATGRNSLKEAFGHKLITNDYHFTQLNEFKLTKAKLDSNNPKKLQEERRAVMTPFEIIREEVKESQKVTQSEQIAALKARAEKAEKTSLNHFISGGFHQVQIPLSQNLKESIKNFQNDEISWIELKVTDKKDSIDLEKTLSSSEFDVNSKQTKLPITEPTQPRFFLCKVPNPDYREISRASTYPLTPASKSSQNSFSSEKEADSSEEDAQDTNLEKSFTEKVKVNEEGEIQEAPEQIEGEEETLSVKDRIKKLHTSNSFDQPSSPQSSESSPKFYTVLIYYCPSNSPPRLRMVYSTCSGGIIQQFDDLKLEINFKIDQFDPFGSNASLAEIHDKVNNYQTQANVTKLGKQLNLTKLVSNSHTQSKLDESESQIKAPKFSQLKRTGHPVFGQLPQ